MQRTEKQAIQMQPVFPKVKSLFVVRKFLSSGFKHSILTPAQEDFCPEK